MAERQYIQRVYIFLSALGLLDVEPHDAPFRGPWTMHYMSFVNRGRVKLHELHGTPDDRGDSMNTVLRLADQFDSFLEEHGAAIVGELGSVLVVEQKVA